MHDLDSILVRTLRPERARLAEVRAAVQGLSGGLETWDHLAAVGAIPASWIDDPERRFHPMRGAAVRHVYGNCWTPCLCRRDFLLAAPKNAHDSIAFASDVDGVAAAEALAREGMRRLLAWGIEMPSPIVWGVVRGARRYSRLHVNALSVVQIKLQVALGDDVFVRHVHRALATIDEVRHRSSPPIPEASFWGLEQQLARRTAWAEACARGLVVPGGFLHPIAAEHQPFATLDDPVEPWIELFGTGYAPWAVGETGVLLAAPGW